MNHVMKACKDILADHYGHQFQGLVLFGSVARNRDAETSDIDLLVLLSPPFDYFVELRKITDLLYPVQLDSDKLISAKPAAKDAYDSGEIQLYRNAQREGVAL